MDKNEGVVFGNTQNGCMPLILACRIIFISHCKLFTYNVLQFDLPYPSYRPFFPINDMFPIKETKKMRIYKFHYFNTLGRFTCIMCNHNMSITL